ncbi:helix-turn-helix transcriptional regulator [Streptomyces lydicus]|nr:helix-turn-helix transcriptional regulator [Streptomyces lydicus]
MPELADTGRRIKELRVSAGMTQHDLAGAEMSSSYISLVERGKRIPSGRALRILAERLGVGVDEISRGAEPVETTSRVRRLDLVGRLVAARRQWEGGDAEGALSEFRALAEIDPAGRQDDVFTEAQLAIAEILGTLGRADEGADVLLRMLDALAPAPYAEARLRALIALADLLESAGRVQDGLRYALTGFLECADRSPGSGFHALLVLEVLTRCAYWSGCPDWAPGTDHGRPSADGVLPGRGPPSICTGRSICATGARWRAPPSCWASARAGSPRPPASRSGRRSAATTPCCSWSAARRRRPAASSSAASSSPRWRRSRTSRCG